MVAAWNAGNGELSVALNWSNGEGLARTVRVRIRIVMRFGSTLNQTVILAE